MVAYSRNFASPVHVGFKQESKLNLLNRQKPPLDVETERIMLSVLYGTLPVVSRHC